MSSACRVLILLFTGASHIVAAQFPTSYTSAEIYHELLKANHLGSVLYVAAHPDDENTRLISYFENKLYARTAYLSLTRGDGGQNLIGTEIGPAIGVLRTQELMAARRIDGGEQYFSRAVDFGYSKSSEETLEKWDREAVLHDMVWVIRKFRPDAIVTRFPPNNYAGHGHHEASALLAEEAFEAAADPNRFASQLDKVSPWQPKRLYFNTSSWWIKDLPDRARNNDNFLRVTVGEYNALLGETYGRIASRSRSQHKSQGFGTDVYYGLNVEYMEYVLGEKANSKADILDGVVQDWSRVNAPEVGQVLKNAIQQFDFDAPYRTVPYLLDALDLLESKSQQDPLVRYKIEELENLLLKMIGLHAEAVSDQPYYTPGEKVFAQINVVHQYPKKLGLLTLEGVQERYFTEMQLNKEEFYSFSVKIDVAPDAAFSNHYWLREPWENMYTVDDLDLLGLPENPPAFTAKAVFRLEDRTITRLLPVQHKKVDPVKAVIYRPVQIVPPVTFNFSEDAIISTSGKSKEVVVMATSHRAGEQGKLSLNLPEGWRCKPAYHPFSAPKNDGVQRFTFSIEASNEATSGQISIAYENNEGSADAWSLQEISYDHIPAQILMTPASIPLQSFELLKGKVDRIGYIEGPGDEVARYLRAAGYKVDLLDASDIQSGGLDIYQAILTGIRAFNTRDDLAYLQPALNAYVANGGTMIVQYNTSRSLNTDVIGPYPFTVGRDRVTDEAATADIIAPNHSVIRRPNKITPSDFDNWVQERGLYFATEWDEAFEPIIAWSDPGEPPRKGGLIIAPHGKGHFVYTGISFFRQLPAGVPGAYRLMGNILDLSTTPPKP